MPHCAAAPSPLLCSSLASISGRRQSSESRCLGLSEVGERLGRGRRAAPPAARAACRARRTMAGRSCRARARSIPSSMLCRGRVPALRQLEVRQHDQPAGDHRDPGGDHRAQAQPVAVAREGASRRRGQEQGGADDGRAEDSRDLPGPVDGGADGARHDHGDQDPRVPSSPPAAGGARRRHSGDRNPRREGCPGTPSSAACCRGRECGLRTNRGTVAWRAHQSS